MPLSNVHATKQPAHKYTFSLMKCQTWKHLKTWHFIDWRYFFFTPEFSIGHKTRFRPNNHIIIIVNRKMNAIPKCVFSYLDSGLNSCSGIIIKEKKWHSKCNQAQTEIIIWRRWWRKMKEKEIKRNGTQNQIVINNSIDPRVKWLNMMKWLQWLHRQAAWKIFVRNERSATHASHLTLFIFLSFIGKK